MALTLDNSNSLYVFDFGTEQGAEQKKGATTRMDKLDL